MSEVNWDQIKDTPQFDNSNKKTDKSKYADLDVGANFFRVVSEKIYGVKIYYAWNRFQKSADAFDSAESICPLAKIADSEGHLFRARPYYLIKVIERKSEEIKALRVPKAVALQLRKDYKDAPEWGPLTGYDIKITKGTPGTNPLYNVSAIPHKPLSAADKALIANDTLNLEELAKPAPVKWVQKFIDDHLSGKPSGKSSGKTTENTTAPASKNQQRTAVKSKPAPAPEPEVSNEFESDEADSSDEIDSDFENL